MAEDFVWAGALSQDVQFGFLDGDIASSKKNHPEVVLNSEGSSVLRTLREEISKCRSFTFSVAFVTPRAIALLKQELVEFAGTSGQIVTSDYLGFNSPETFYELKNLERLGIDVRIHDSKAFHAKGYIFQHDQNMTLMVGSSNLTEGAISRNHEWNLKVSASADSDLAGQVAQLVEGQVRDSVPLSTGWIAEYAQRYSPPVRGISRPTALPETSGEVVIGTEDSQLPILPNSMQTVALREIELVRTSGVRRAIVISATGTGKTILSALEVRAANPERFLFIVHREQIVDKTIKDYKRVLGGDSQLFGKLSGSSKEIDRRYVFATIQTLAQDHILHGVKPDSYDYVIVDEAHRVGSASYTKVLKYLAPKFLLGMTATPERGDGFNVFEFFDYNVPYEVRLNHALEADMLSPFHYYGIADVELTDGQILEADADLSRLVTEDRVSHIVQAIETYGQAGVQPRGLIFCSRNEEAAALSTALNELELWGNQLRTLALSGAHSPADRELAVTRLEAGEIDYILTVDIFNEGVDIPSVNQVIMLRQTQSAIVFVQQLGRGLRKAQGKEYLVVIDFIGNYANNYMIPIALFGDESLNKESLKEKLIAAEQSGVLPGLSSVRFDKVSQQRVMESIGATKLDGMANLKSAIQAMRNRVSGAPRLWDFYRFESVDPILLATKRENYVALLAAVRIDENDLSLLENRALSLLSHEVLPAKRKHEFLLARALFDRGEVDLSELSQIIGDANEKTSELIIQSAIDTFTLSNHSAPDRDRYRVVLADQLSDTVKLQPEIWAAYRTGGRFADEVDDLIRTGNQIAEDKYSTGNPFVSGAQYSRKEVTRLLGMPRKWTSTLYGYKVDPNTATCPIFVTLHKSDEVSASVAYGDELLDQSTMRWFTKSRRTLKSGEIQPILHNEVDLHVFVKKDDAEGSEFFYLGQATSSNAMQDQMQDDKGKTLDVVQMQLAFAKPIEAALYDYYHPIIL